MVKKIDKETAEILTNALEKLNAYKWRWVENREKRLWKEVVNIPCSLHEALNRLTKNELDKIRKNYDFKNLSALKKSELASEFVRLIPLKFKNVLYTMDQGRYDIIKTIVKNSGIIPDIGLSISQIEGFIKYGMLFPGIYENKKVLFMPTELMNIFIQSDGSELESVVRRNTEWVSLTHGMLYYYGVIEAWHVKEKIEEITGEAINFREFLKVMSFACDFHGQVSITPYGYKDKRVFNAKEIAEEQSKRSDIDYYRFSKEQLLKAADPDYIEKTPQMNSFIDFLSEYYRITDQKKNEMVSEITNIIISGSEIDLIFNYLESRLEYPSYELAQAIVAKIMDIYNNTRQWILKGHTPNELFQKEKKFLKPLPPELFKTSTSNAKVIDLATRTKVGRNEPCPCGSGKKYKKCCGKYHD